eukprot:gene5361-5578_t
MESSAKGAAGKLKAKATAAVRGSKVAARGGIAKRGRGRGGGRGSEAVAAEGPETEAEASLSCRGWFSKDYLVEDIVVDYMKEMTTRSAELAAETLKTKIDEKDLLFLVRKEPAKFGRVKDLLMMNQVIKEVRNSVYKDDEAAAAAAEE